MWLQDNFHCRIGKVLQCGSTSQTTAASDVEPIEAFAIADAAFGEVVDASV